MKIDLKDADIRSNTPATNEALPDLALDAWNLKYADFIQLYNAEIDEHGTALQEWRQF